MESGDSWVAAARAWMADDPDPSTRSELAQLIDSDDHDGLRDRFACPIDFGTAGLRALLGAGPARLNRVTVMRVSAALARQLRADVPHASTRGIVLGRDGRHMSAELARCAAEIFAGHGLQVHWFGGPVPTPVAAFAGRYMGAAATCVITASHNPPQYNGVKIYSALGTQIVSPQDARIREELAALGTTAELPRSDFEKARDEGTICVLGDSVAHAYLEALDGQCHGQLPPPQQLKVVTTALHGVGHAWLERALHRRGFTDLHSVPEQAQPDPDFPTVRFPNPEESGALDYALALAKERGAELVLANDPDADRLCVAERVSGDDFRVLSGNELGVLLADWIIGSRIKAGSLSPDALVVTTIVSTGLLARLASVYGIQCEETLTGFKWICQAALSAGDNFLFGFEEALGYCCGLAVRDKDGIGAAQVLMELAAATYAEGSSLHDRLDRMAREHGVYATSQVATVLPGHDGRARIEGTMKSLRRDPPDRIGGSEVTRFRDLLSDGPDQVLPISNVLTWWLSDGARITLRPSGTEPKLKAYVEVRCSVDGEALEVVRQRADERLRVLEEWSRRVVLAGTSLEED